MSWVVSFIAAAAIGMLAPEPLRGRAFAAGWFERAGETDRPRSTRRPTHGGAVAGVALVVAAVVAGVTEPVGRGALAGVGIALLTGVRQERHARPRSLRLGRALAAVAVSVAGARMELTGNDITDLVLVGLLALGVVEGFDHLQHSDGAMVLVAGIGGAGLLVSALRVDEAPVATVAAGLAGVALALAAHALPPAVLLLGRSGPGVLGVATVAVAVAHRPAVGQPTGTLVPLLLCAVPLSGLVVPGLDQRLAARGVPAAPALGVAAVTAAVAAVLVGGGDVAAPLAVVGALPIVLLGLIGVATPRPTVLSPRPRWLTPVLLVTAAAAVAMAGYGAATAVQARSDVYAGRDHAERGLAAARDGELELAQAEFESAQERFRSADQRLASPLLRVAEATVPGVAQNLRAAGVLIASGDDLASTAVAVAERAGAEDLRVVDGRVPIDAAADVGSELARARQVLGDTQDRLVAIDSDWLVEEARTATAALAEQVAEADASIEVAAETTRLLPSLLGGDRDRRWFVAVLSSSELRGAGGLLGNFAVLSAVDGVIDLEQSAGISRLNASTDPADADVLPAVFAAQYASWSPGRFWQNLSVTPDFPTMGEAVRALAPRSDAGPIDGVIGIDPLGLAALVELTGPVDVASWPVPLGPDNIAEVLLFEQYRAFPADDQVDAFQSDLVSAIVDALTAGELAPPSELAATLAPAVAGGHLRLFSAEDEEQALFERIGADGGLRQPPAADFFQLVSQNGSESKIDHFLRREVDYAVEIAPDTGATTATVTVTLHNGAPSEGLPSYIIGGRNDTAITAAGEMRFFTTIVTTMAVTSVQVDDGPERPVQLGSEQGLLTGTVLHRIAPGDSSTLVFRLEGRWDPELDYRIALGRQPTAHPDAVAVHVGGETVRFEQVEARTVTVPTSDRDTG